jgi:hypothetical protein
MRTASPELIRGAATRFERVFADGKLLLFPQVAPGDTKRTLVRCYFWAGDKTEARTCAQAWTCEAPDDPDAWRMLARCYRDTGDSDALADAYEHYARLSPTTDQNWEVTELLGLGLERRNQSRLLAGIEKLLSARERPASRAILALEWPTLSSLSADAQEKWWLGVAVACDPASEATFGNHRCCYSCTPA